MNRLDSVRPTGSESTLLPHPVRSSQVFPGVPSEFRSIFSQLLLTISAIPTSFHNSYAHSQTLYIFIQTPVLPLIYTEGQSPRPRPRSNLFYLVLGLPSSPLLKDLHPTGTLARIGTGGWRKVLIPGKAIPSTLHIFDTEKGFTSGTK